MCPDGLRMGNRRLAVEPRWKPAAKADLWSCTCFPPLNHFSSVTGKGFIIVLVTDSASPVKELLTQFGDVMFPAQNH